MHKEKFINLDDLDHKKLVRSLGVNIKYGGGFMSAHPCSEHVLFNFVACSRASRRA